MIAVSEKQLNKVTGGILFPIPGTLTGSTAKFLPYKNRSINDVVLLADGGKLKAYNGSTVSEVVPHVPYDAPNNGTPQESTDPGLNDLSNLTNFRTIAIKKDRIFAAAHPTVKNRVSFCYHDPYIGYAVYDYWPAIYFFDVGVEDNDEIVELKVFRNVLIILCKRSVWALKGDGASLLDYELVKINVPKGCISSGSIQEVGNNLFYLGDDHVYSIFATEQEFISAQIMSMPIHPILKSIGLADKAKAASIFHDGKYYLSFPSGLTLVYDVSLECWTKYTNIPANSFMEVDNELYFSDSKGFIYRFNENIYTDDGDAISFAMKTKLVDFELPVHVKKIKRVWLLLKQFQGYESSCDIKANIDQFDMIDVTDLGRDAKKGLGAIWDKSVWGDAIWDFAEVMLQEIKMNSKGNSIQFQIENKNIDEPATIYGIVIEYQVKKPKRR